MVMITEKCSNIKILEEPPIFSTNWDGPFFRPNKDVCYYAKNDSQMKNYFAFAIEL